MSEKTRANRFEFTVVGKLERGLDELFLLTHKGSKLRVVPTYKEYPTQVRLWHLLPQIDSTAIISSVQILGTSAVSIEAPAESEKVVLVGKVLQLGKRTRAVLFQVELPGGKLFKITLANPDPRMKVEQVWSVSARLEERKLQIVEALLLTPVAELDPEQQLVAADEQANPRAAMVAKLTTNSIANVPTQKAIDALTQETGLGEWEVSPPVSRACGWEWEAVSPQTGSKARVAINGDRTLVHQFSSDTMPPLQQKDTERLVVTALGAARGIGASCFRVEIGPYEVVLDCGTRPRANASNKCIMRH